MAGDGHSLRDFTYVGDLVDGIYMLMRSDIAEPTNIETPPSGASNVISAVSSDGVAPTALSSKSRPR